MRGWILAGAVGLGIASAGCALEQRVTHLEHESKEKFGVDDRVGDLETNAKIGSALLVKWHKTTLERMARIEAWEERARREFADLERWRGRLEAREAALARGEAVRPATSPSPQPESSPAPTTSPAPTASPTKPTTTAPTTASPDPKFNADSLYVSGTRPWADPFALTSAKQLTELYSTGQRPADSQWLDSTDSTAPAGPSTPLKPRDPGEKGKDGESLLGRELKETKFLSSTTDTVDISRFKGKKNVVLVVLRGFDGAVCVACSGQTLAISQNLDEFEKRDAEVYLLYPGKAESVPVFIDAVQALQGGARSLPVEILLDVDLSVVHEFKIEGRLAKPSTLIIDKKGIVRFAHVGQSKTDRPTVPQMLEALDRIAKSEQGK